MSNQNRGTIRQLSSYLHTQDFIKKEEGLKLTPYICSAGVKTIGWGHALTLEDCRNLNIKSFEDTITEDKALELLESDMVKAYQALFRLVHVPLTDNQQTALVSFIFNLGSGRFQASTLRQKLNRKEYKAASSEFDRWVYANDPTKGLVKLKGLASRRRREKMVFLEQGYQSMPLKTRLDILPFQYQKPVRSSRPMAAASPSIFQKIAVVFMGIFKTG